MLLQVGRERYVPSSERDSVHNYFEQMVFDQLLRSNDRTKVDSDYLADCACVALNRLPPRYVRHDVDMTFFLTPDELDAMITRVVEAVNDAVTYVDSREQEHAENQQDEPDSNE